MPPMDLAVRAHRTFRHGTPERAKRLLDLDDADGGVKDTGMRQHDIDADVRAEAHRIVEDSGESPSRPACAEGSTRDN